MCRKSLGVDRKKNLIWREYIPLRYVTDNPHYRPPFLTYNFFKVVELWNHRFSPMNEVQRTILACRPYYNCLRHRRTPDITTSGPLECPPSTPITPSVKEYPSAYNDCVLKVARHKIFLHSNSIYFGTFLNNYCPFCIEIFKVAREHRWHQDVRILGNSDDGIF